MGAKYLGGHTSSQMRYSEHAAGDSLDEVPATVKHVGANAEKTLQASSVTKTLALVEATVLACPHRPPPEKRTVGQNRITNDSDESTSFRTDT